MDMSELAITKRHLARAEKRIASLTRQVETKDAALRVHPMTRQVADDRMVIQTLRASLAAANKAQATPGGWQPRVEVLTQTVEQQRARLAELSAGRSFLQCLNCEKLFVSRRADARTCSPRCRTALSRKRHA